MNNIDNIIQFIKQHQTMVVAILCFIVLAGLVILPLLQPKESNDDTQMEEKYVQEIASSSIYDIAIDNFNDHAENLPDKERSVIESVLRQIVELNVLGRELPSSGAVIRDGSYTQTLKDPVRQVYFTTFIVDIPALQQSYRIENNYSPLPAQVSNLYNDTTEALCLNEKDLIYGEFNCVDWPGYGQEDT
jgi:hypothetical protein